MSANAITSKRAEIVWRKSLATYLLSSIGIVCCVMRPAHPAKKVAPKRERGQKADNWNKFAYFALVHFHDSELIKKSARLLSFAKRNHTMLWVSKRT